MPGNDREGRDSYYAAEGEWVATYRSLVASAFEYFEAHGDWPEVERLQRQIDRTDVPVDVRHALEVMPRVAGETRPYLMSQAVIPLRFLNRVEEAAPYVQAALSLLNHARDLYQSADLDDALVIRSTDPEVLELGGLDEFVVLRAGQLLDTEGVKPVAGGKSGSDSWQYSVIPDRIRQLPQSFNAAQFFRWQDDLYLAASRLEPRPSSWPSTVDVPATPAAQEEGEDDLWFPGSVRAFLSHLAIEKAFTAGVSDELAGWGVSGFVAHDSIEPSREWQAEIERGLRSADVLVGILHTGFRDSSWTQQEVGWAYGRGIPTLMVRVSIEDPTGFVGRFQAPRTKASAAEVAAAIVLWLARLPEIGPRVVSSTLAGIRTARSYVDGRDAANRLEALGRLTPEVLNALDSEYRDNDQVYGHIGGQIIEGILRKHGREPSAPWTGRAGGD